MIVNDSKIIFNINTLVCLPKQYEKEAYIYEHNFKYVYLFTNTMEGINEFLRFVNQNNVQELVLVDYRLEYESIIKELKNKVLINILETFDLASLSVDTFLNYHDSINRLCKEKRINKLGVLDKNLYLIQKTQFNETYHVKLDVPIDNNVNTKNNTGIGLINDSPDPRHSFYNELSAISLLNEKANLVINKEVERFIKTFNINSKQYSDVYEVLNNSEINLYVNFCNTNNSLFIKSMDRGTICILGNNSIINENEALTKYLQVESDDNINEIADKINEVRKNKEAIFEEYKKFRANYSIESKKSIEDFVIGNEENRNDEEYEKLLTVGIPVYNVEDYVAASIESVLKAINPNNTEILIVNDGSTDNSKEIVLAYKHKYPNIIRFIDQKNHGLGNVRNVIMDNAKGKYIASIDSDDTINKDLFREAEKYLKQDIDMVICDWLSIFKEKEKYPTEALDFNLNFASNYKKIFYSTIMPSNCNKIVKKELYKKLDLRFLEGLKYEDFGTNPIIMNKVQTIMYINKPYYEYNIRENSIMRTSAGYNMIDVLKILEERFKKYVKEDSINKKEFVAYVYFWRIEELIINQLYGLEENERNDIIDYMYKNINNVLEEVFKDNEYTDFLIDRVDEDTKKYIKLRNEKILKGEFKEFLTDRLKTKDYKILTPALILYNFDNRENK